MKSPYCIKICSKCGKLLIANETNFRKRKNGKYGLRAECRKCEQKYKQEWSKREETKEKQKEICKKYYNNHKKQFHEYNSQYYEEHKEVIKENRRQYYEDNKEKCKKCNKQWHINNPDKVFNKCQKRRLREESQGNGITKEQWLEMMEFFNWSCAYSGIQLNKNNRSIDHIIPLDKNGENEIWNMCPMYMPYNSSKNIKNMEEWYVLQDFYSEERLNKIYEWIEYAKNKYQDETPKE